MDELAEGLISILRTDGSNASLRQSMKDMSKLAGVIAELGQGDYFDDPVKTHQFFLLLNILNEEALGLTSAIEDGRTLQFRYRNVYGHNPDIDVNRLVAVLDKFGWIHKGRNKITMLDVGKRMMDMLLRSANDSLAFYMQDEITRSLYQAKRDADLSEAYDDKGVSGGNKLASMIKNVEEAVEKLKERELEYLADRYALPQVQIIHSLIRELNERFEERIQKFETFEEGIQLEPLMKRGTAVVLEGIHVSYGTIRKILKFTHLQESSVAGEIRHDTLRGFMQNCFTKLDRELPDAHEILSFMEQDRRDGEQLDGIWVPVKFASPLSPTAIATSISYLEDYPVYEGTIDEMPDEAYEEIEEWTEEQIAEKMRDQQWSMTKEMIHTERLEEYFQHVHEADIEEMMIEVGSREWADAINVLTALSAMTANEKTEIIDAVETKDYILEKEWEWMSEDDRRKRIRAKSGKRI